jgi:hypothetical protein
MSEYQYYEWQTVDRTLTPEEKTAISKLSSHIDVTSSQAVVTYNWGDFKHDPRQVLARYFDAHFYLANWGTLRLMFRFPVGLLDEAAIEPYCVDECISFEKLGDHHILDLDFNPEDGGWTETECSLSSFIHLRDDLIQGDYRLLYLAWLKAVTLYGLPGEDDDFVDLDELEPPVPAGLKELSPPLKRFAQVFKVSRSLLKAAAEASPDIKARPPVDYRSLVARLSRAECDDFLTRLAEGDSAVGAALRKHLTASSSQNTPQQITARRTLRQLIDRGRKIRKAERERQEEEARKRHIAEMETLASREIRIWEQISTLLDSAKTATIYDQATELLGKMKQLADYRGTQADFQKRLQALATKYGTRTSLMRRWRDKKWL